MKKRRIGILTLALASALLITGCSTSSDTANQDGDTVTVVGAYSQKVGTEVPPDTTPENQSFVKAAKDVYNINIKYLWTCPPDQFEQKIGVAMASGDLPDVMSVDVRQYEMLRDSGQLADISSALENAASDKFKGYLYKNPEMMERMTDDEGKVYAIPQYWDSKRDLDLMYIRQDWLDNLGLSVPQTVEELKEVAIAFSKNDPDGNGQEDTCGIAMAKGVDAWMCDIKSYFASMNAYPKKWLSDGSGGVMAGEIQPEMKEALSFMHELYAEGALDKEFITKDETKITEEIIAGRYGIVYGPWHQMDAYLGKSIENTGANWVAYPIPGIGGQGKPAIDRLTIEKYFVVNKNCENPEAVIKLFNLFCDFTPGNYGEQATEAGGYVWDWVPTAYYDPYDIDTMYDKINKAMDEGPDSVELDADEQDVYERYQNYLKYQNGELPFSDAEFSYVICRVAKDGTWAQTRKIYDAGMYVFNEVSGMTCQSYQDKGVTLDTMTDEIITKIIVGESDISAFDQYVEDWKNLGGDDITREFSEQVAAQP